jgi:hypothetical protein
MTTLSTVSPLGEHYKVTILTQMPRDRQTFMIDTLSDLHHSEIDGKTTHQVALDGTSDHQTSIDEKIRHQSSTDRNRQMGDGNHQSKSAIIGRLCKRVLAYIKWRSDVNADIDISVMDSLGCWLHNRGISVHIDSV